MTPITVQMTLCAVGAKVGLLHRFIVGYVWIGSLIHSVIAPISPSIPKLQHYPANRHCHDRSRGGGFSISFRPHCGAVAEAAIERVPVLRVPGDRPAAHRGGPAGAAGAVDAGANHRHELHELV